MLSEVLEELRNNFHLKKNHLMILKLLLAEACTADEICERTTIPKGRIYNLLNELISMRLIEREQSVPAIYSMKNPNDTILNFLKYAFSKEVQKQTRVIAMLEEKAKFERIEMIITNEAYDYEQIALIMEAKWLKTIHRELSISWFIQPRDENEFWKVRQEINKRRRASTTPKKDISILKYRAYADVYKDKPIEQIMTKEALEAYANIIRDLYGKKAVKQWAKDVIEGLEKHKNVKLYILDTPSSMFNTFISDKAVLYILISKGEITGIKLIGNRAVDLYEKYFEELRAKTKPIQEYLKLML